MDALSTVLESASIKSLVYSKLELSSPWGIDVLKDNNSQFWRLIKGACVIGLPNKHIVEMEEGDMIFVPNGGAHWLGDKVSSSRVVASVFTKARLNGTPLFNGPGIKTTLIGGHFHFLDESMPPFLSELPQIIHIRHCETKNQLLIQQMSKMILEELDEEKPGSKIVLKCLSEILFVNIIRDYLEQETPEDGFLAAIMDTRISKALRLMHDFPETNWSLQTLSMEVAMSRSVFFNQFKKLMNETPNDYLTNWRIKLARRLLVTDNLNIADIAMKVGYQSEAAFNRIFKAKTGKTPAAYRRDD